MNKNKLLLISSIAVSNIGDIMFDLFIAWELSNVPGHFMNAVYIIGTSIAFRALLCFFVGFFVDRYPNKKIMIFSHISSMVVILCFSFLWEVIKLHVSIGLLFVLLNDINNELFKRSYISMTAYMFNDNEYIKFQSQANIVTRTVTIGGSACVGILINYISSHAIFFIDILSYIFSLLLILPIIYNENKMQKVSSAKI